MLLAGTVRAQEESRADAWWTGPMLAANAASLPQGHWLVEPYLFDEVSNGTFDSDGNRHSGPYEHTIGSLSYILYGLTDSVGVGLLPHLAYNEPAGAANSSGVQFGDLTLQASYGLLHFRDGDRTPDVSVVVQEILPTGRYDRLSRLADGVGSGAYSTALALYTQDYFWLPNGRILRARLDFTYTLSSSASVEGLSVYGTTAGFSGRAYPGDGFTADASAEYSVTRNWVVALDLVYQHNDSTRVSGLMEGSSVPGIPTPFTSASGSSYSLGFAPAIEYNFSAAIGVLLGVRIIDIGRNTSSTITPALALNMVF
jgi:Putative MetA-pathway of phenol degradation